MVVKGGLTIKNSDRQNRQKDIVLDGITRRIADLDVDLVYLAINKGDDPVVFQVTENMT